MNEIFKKLKLKDQKQILVLNVADEFMKNVKEEIEDGVVVHDERMPSTIYDFAVVFVNSIEEIGVSLSMVVKSLAWSNTTLWVAFSRQESKKYKTDITLEDGWDVMGEIGFVKGEYVQIDDDWGAYNFIRK